LPSALTFSRNSSKGFANAVPYWHELTARRVPSCEPTVAAAHAASFTKTAEAIRFSIIVFSRVCVRRARRGPDDVFESAMLTRFGLREARAEAALRGRPIG